MSIELQTQMVEYGKQMLDAAPPITEAELTTVLSDETVLHEARPRTRRLGPWVGVSAAALTLGLFGVVALFVSGDEPPANTDSFAWSRVPPQAVLGGSSRASPSMNEVTAGGPGFVAVGSDLDAAAVWASVDGITWDRMTVLPDFAGQRMESVTSGGPGLVAVGTSVWTSPDGTNWTRRETDMVSHDTSALTGVDWQLMTSVTTGGPGLVAVGINWGEDADSAVWTSPDGITWTRVPHDEAAFGGTLMSSVTAGGPGLVAVGWDNSGGDADAAIWTSIDGITWSRVAHDETALGGDGHQSMRSVTAFGSELVAVGWDALGDTRSAAVWTSPDGVSWSRVSHDEAIFGSLQMDDVTVADSGLVAVGTAESDPQIAVIWTSPDGTTWTRVPHDESVFGEAQMESVTAGATGLVAVGGSDKTGDAAVWVATP